MVGVEGVVIGVVLEIIGVGKFVRGVVLKMGGVVLEGVDRVGGVDQVGVSYLHYAFIFRRCSSVLGPSAVHFFPSLVARGYNPRRY